MNNNQILCGDFAEIMPTIPDNSVELILTDPPYAEEYNYLWPILAEQAARVLKSGGNLITLCGHHQLPVVIKSFEGHLRYWWPLWMRQNKINILCGKWVAPKGKPGLWFVKEKRRKIDGQHIPWDSIDGKNGDDWAKSQKRHKWGQSVGWFQHYIEKLTLENEVVLDPFVGGGSVPLACIRSKRNFIGIEKDCQTYENCLKAIEDENSA